MAKTTRAPRKRTGKKPKTATPSRRGRPKGATTQPVDQATATITRCPRCGSTERAPYMNRHEQPITGLDASGQPFTHLVRRRTKCLSCSQHRIDRHYENRPAKKK